MLLKQKQILEIFWWKFLSLSVWLGGEQRNVVLCSQFYTYTDNLLVFYWQLVPHISLYSILISQSHNASYIYIPQPFLSLQLDLFLVEIHYWPDQWLIDQYFNVCTLWNFPHRELETRKPIFLSNKSGLNSVSIKSISSGFEVAQTLLLTITHSASATSTAKCSVQCTMHMHTSHHFSNKNVILYFIIRQGTV